MLARRTRWVHTFVDLYTHPQPRRCADHQPLPKTLARQCGFYFAKPLFHLSLIVRIVRFKSGVQLYCRTSITRRTLMARSISFVFGSTNNRLFRLFWSGSKLQRLRIVGHGRTVDPPPPHVKHKLRRRSDWPQRDAI